MHGKLYLPCHSTPGLVGTGGSWQGCYDATAKALVPPECHTHLPQDGELYQARPSGPAASVRRVLGAHHRHLACTGTLSREGSPRMCITMCGTSSLAT